jgi:hypothetical protein
MEKFRYPLKGRLGSQQSLWSFAEEKGLSSLPEIENILMKN